MQKHNAEEREILGQIPGRRPELTGTTLDLEIAYDKPRPVQVHVDPCKTEQTKGTTLRCGHRNSREKQFSHLRAARPIGRGEPVPYNHTRMPAAKLRILVTTTIQLHRPGGRPLRPLR